MNFAKPLFLLMKDLYLFKIEKTVFAVYAIFALWPICFKF